MIIVRILMICFMAMNMIILESNVAYSQNKYSEANEETRSVAVQNIFDQNTDLVVIYAQGLCCPSCAIGVRKKVSKLNFVDRSRLNKGVNLDAKKQLVSVAIHPDKEVDITGTFVALKEIPRSPSGKVVKAALTDPSNQLQDALER